MKSNPKTSRRASSGFTLVELLVVIAMIAVLVAIGIGAMFKFRKSADKLNAGNSLRQMQVANIAYASDHNGKFMAVYDFDDKKKGSYWPDNAEFLTLLFGSSHVYGNNGQKNINVPDGFLDKPYVKAAGNDVNAKRFYGGSYGYNQTTEIAATGLTWGGESSYGGARLSKIKNPARTAAFALCTDWILKYNGRLKYLTDPTDGYDSSGMLAFRYGDKVPVAFYDGHVEYVSPGEIKKFDANGGKENPFWDGTKD